ncbi:MAG: hypothetical protein JEZ07_00465 [Phycisphaerae bacterium]|nr:hypothetical protein [Phycisphaerae bacterium]
MLRYILFVLVAFIAVSGCDRDGGQVISLEKVDYLEKMNQHVRPQGVSEDKNGMIYLDKSISLYVKTEDLYFDGYGFDRGKYSDEQLSEFRHWIEDNEPAWEEFQKFSKSQYSWPKYELMDDGDFAGTIDFSSNLFSVREITKMVASRADLAILDGNVNDAINIYCLLIENAKKMYREEFTLIEQIIWMSVGGIGFDGLKFIIDHCELNDKQLGGIEQELKRIYPAGFVNYPSSGEKLHYLFTIENGFDEKGEVKIEFLTQVVAIDTMLGEEVYLDFDEIAKLHASKEETIAALQKQWDYFEGIKADQLTPYEIHSRNIDTNKVISELDQEKYFVLTYESEILGGFLFSHVQDRRKAEFDSTMAILAVKRFEIKENTLPGSLTELVDKGYLGSLPMDPFSDGPLVYKKNENDFLLYSVGENFNDDAGKSWDYINDKDCDDMVYWPVEDRWVDWDNLD